MSHRISGPRLSLLALFAALFWSGPVPAQEKEVGWSGNSELTFVLTAGNSSSSTLGLKTGLDRVWENAAVRFSAGGIRTEATTVSRAATGTASSFSVAEVEDTEKTAENYFVRGRYDRNVSDATFLFGGVGWERNTFAGFDNRYALVSGVGQTWFEEESRKFRTDVGLTYTVQDDVVKNPDVEDSFLGLRASWDYLRSVTETTDYGSTLIVDENLDETSDLRADLTNWIAVQMAEGLALKTSLQLLFDNEPALVSVPLQGTEESVLTELDRVDSVFTVALVVKF
jgi:putative salt-induced outer membrane protein YdiY